MRATYSPSTFGMHHMSLRHGLRPFSASRRRTQALVLGELDHGVGQQFQRPASAARRRVRAGGCCGQGFLLARELALRPRPGAPDKSTYESKIRRCASFQWVRLHRKARPVSGPSSTPTRACEVDGDAMLRVAQECFSDRLGCEHLLRR